MNNTHTVQVTPRSNDLVNATPSEADYDKAYNRESSIPLDTAEWKATRLVGIAALDASEDEAWFVKCERDWNTAAQVLDFASLNQAVQARAHADKIESVLYWL